MLVDLLLVVLVDQAAVALQALLELSTLVAVAVAVDFRLAQLEVLAAPES